MTREPEGGAKNPQETQIVKIVHQKIVKKQKIVVLEELRIFERHWQILHGK